MIILELSTLFQGVRKKVIAPILGQGQQDSTASWGTLMPAKPDDLSVTHMAEGLKRTTKSCAPPHRHCGFSIPTPPPKLTNK